MKLHLPKQLFVAVLAAAAQVYAWEDVTTTLQGNYPTITQTGSGYKPGYVGGYIASSNTNAGSMTDPINEEFNKNNVTINVTGTEADPTTITYLVGIGPDGYSAIGDKTINIGGEADHVYIKYVVGGVYYNMKGTLTANFTNRGQHVAGSTWVTLQSTNDKKIEINVTGGTVGQIIAGNNNGSTVISAAMNSLLGEGMTESELTEYLAGNPAWSTQEKVVINVSGGKVGYASDGTAGLEGDTAAIAGAGGKGFSVNNTVSINISGDADIYGDVYAGAQNREFELTVGGVSKKIGTQSHINSSEINLSGGTIDGNVYGGGLYNEDSSTQSLVKEGTAIKLSGGTVTGNVYGAGDRDNVDGGTKITIEGTGTAVGGTINGGGNNSTVSGDRLLTVASNHKGTQNYKLADFKNIEVAGDLALESLSVATDTDGTSVNVQKEGSIETKAGVLTNLNELNVDGTLNIDMNGADATKDAVSGKVLTMGDNAVINVMLDGAEAANSIALFGFDDIQDDADDLIITLNGKLVDAALWDFTGGNLVIQEASTTTLNLSRNQSRFYNAARAAAAADPDNLALIELTTARDEAAVKAVIDAMSGHEYATAMSSQIEGNLGHLRRLHGAMGKGEMLGKVTDAKMGTTTVSPWRAGVSVFHEETEIDSDARGDGYDRSETGAMLNVEYLTRKDVTLGGAISYGRTNLRTDGAARRHEDNTRFDVYALYGQKRWSFATSLGLGMHEHELLGGDVDGYSINFLQDAAYTVLSNEKSNVQVFGTVESSRNDIDGCSDGVVSAGSQDAWATDVTAGVRYNRALRAFGNAPGGVFTAQTGVTASIGDIKSGVDMNLGGYGYRQESATRNRWGWNLGAGVDVPVRSNVSVYGTAEAVLRGDSNSVDGQIGVKVSF
ncbi:MAG: autotransporter outer membrane beta-barrel domain-containing protein [Akkermansiaceae bacterium]|nr:autotransporter outer membrane beta-barrel domain-containing protein [Akkermansiaceae bacterium]